MKRPSQLSDKEIAMIKGLLDKGISNQEILNKFSVPARTVNAGRISEIKTGKRGVDIASASEEDVDRFMGGKIKLNELAGHLFSLGHEEEIFGVKYNGETLEVSTSENGSLEYKQYFEVNSIPVYLKILAGMLNAGFDSGGIIFGIADAPPKIMGVKRNLPEGFLDPWHEGVRAHFAPFFPLQMEAAAVADRRLLRVFLSHKRPASPVICCKEKHVQTSRSESEMVLEEGAIYHRYGESTRKIRYSDLRALIDRLMGAGDRR